jgi:glucan phosphoethanolaminetransferase (alkaline phosphatase superfamily)
MPPLVAAPAKKRNVVMLITESVRAQSVCLDYSEACRYTPFSNKAVPERIALTQMRALDSTTAISLAIMWSGHDPAESRKDLHSAPLLWEYLKAANLEGTYWTSQNLLYGNSGTWIASVPLTRHVSATQLEPEATMELGSDDGNLVDYALNDMDGVHEPYLEVVHLSNTHFPYKVDARYSPFQPEAMVGGPGYENEIRNRYQDSIYLQDVAIGRLRRKIDDPFPTKLIHTQRGLGYVMEERDGD